MGIDTSLVVRFGIFEVDPRSGELRKGGSRLHLQEKPLQVLLQLVERQGELVTRDELREALWSADTFVDFDHSLGTAVAKLRSTLGDSARSPRFIETVGGRGYRFIAPVAFVAREAASTPAPEPATFAAAPNPDVAEAAPAGTGIVGRAPWLAGSLVAGLLAGALLLIVLLGFDVGGARDWLRRQSSAPVHSLAVLPLQNLSGDAGQDYLVDGVTEQLIATLAQLPGLQVISRTSAMHYKGSSKPLPAIGRELHADAIIEGSVVRVGDRVRITAQLVDARTDQHLWAQSYERNFADVLTLQNDIARSIASEIRVQLTPAADRGLARSRTSVPAAQEAYLRGRYHYNRGDEVETRKSIDEFKDAIRLDPQDPRPLTGLAQAYIALADFYERPAETMPRARAAAEQALSLDATLSDAHAALGAVRFLYDWDFRGAETEFTRALELNPASPDAHVWYGVFLGQMGRFDQGIAELRRADTLDPLSVPVHISAGWVYYLARRGGEAIQEWRKALDLDPNLGVAHTSIWLAYAQKGERWPGVTDATPEAIDASPLNMATVAGLYATAGDRPQAEAMLTRITSLADHRYVCAYEIATARAALHDDDAAIEWLQRGLRDRSICMPDLKVDPRFERLRADPRFKELLREIGFGV